MDVKARLKHVASCPAETQDDEFKAAAIEANAAGQLGGFLGGIWNNPVFQKLLADLLASLLGSIGKPPAPAA